MEQTIIHAVFQNGVFRLVEKINWLENQEVDFIIQEHAETAGIGFVAESGGAFDYLADPQEDIYSAIDVT